MKYFLGTLVIALGAFMVIKTQWFIENFGYSDWAEAKLGGGGTRLMYKLLGVIFIFGTLMILTGMMGEIFVGILGKYFGLT